MAKKGLVARPLAAQDLSAFDSLAERHGCFFDRLAWTAIWGERLKRVGLYGADGCLRGGFCLFEVKRLGLRVLRNPPYTPQIGPFFEYRAKNPAAAGGERREVQEALAAYLAGQGAAVVSLGLAVRVRDGLPFYWRGFKVVPRYTYQIALGQEEREILAAMAVERRNDMSKAERDGIRVEDLREVGPFRSLVMDTYARQGMGFPVEEMDRVLGAFPPGSESYGFLSVSGGEPLAGVYIVHDAETAYCLMTGYRSSGSHRGAGALAMTRAILRAREMGLRTFDFEGSVIPPIESYFRGFGGALTPYFTVQRAWLPIEMLLKLRYRERF